MAAPIVTIQNIDVDVNTCRELENGISITRAEAMPVNTDDATLIAANSYPVLFIAVSKAIVEQRGTICKHVCRGVCGEIVKCLKGRCQAGSGQMTYVWLMNERYQPEQAIEQANPPDYSGFSRRQLAQAERVERHRVLRAGWGHLGVKFSLFVVSYWGWVKGKREGLDWDADPHGVDPELDEEEKDAKTKLAAIREELDVRREWRMNPRPRSRVGL